MEIFEQIVALIGHLAWPLVALAIGIVLVRKLERGFLAKIVNPGGSIEYGGVKLTVAEQAEQAKRAVETAHISLQTPAYAEGIEEAVDPDSDNLLPYEAVMTAWSELAEAITRVSIPHDGWDDRRQVWSNLEVLKAKGIIDANTVDAVRSVQKVRNSIRRTGQVDRATARKYAESAYSLKKHFDSR